MRHRRRRGRGLRGGRVRAAVAVVALQLLSFAALGGPWGVPLGKRAVKTDVASAGDVDAYLIEAHAGARLDVKLGVAKRSALLADAELLGPDGTPTGAVFESSGRSLRLRRFEIPESGRYELRVSGRDGSTGAYSVSARLAGSPTVSMKGLHLAAREERAFAFAAGGGAVLDFTIRSKPSAVTFARVEAPNGVFVPVPAGAVRANAGGRLQGKSVPLPATGAFGTWRLVVRADAGALDGVRARITTRGGRLDEVRGALPDGEPSLLAVVPGEAGAGTGLVVTGTGLVSAKKRALRVFVGGIEATDVVVDSATSLRATVPGGTAGRVDVGVLNGDGHAVVLRDGLLVVPPPRITSFEPERGPAGGGTEVLVHGSGFREGTAVTVAGTAFGNSTEVLGDDLLRFTTPSFAGGPQTLGVRDPTGQEGSASATFDFVAAPFVLEVLPPVVPHLAGETVLLRGGAFTAEQTVTIGGVPPDVLALTSANELRLQLPELAVGKHDVTVRDPLDQVSTTRDGLSVFTFTAGASSTGTGGPPPSDIALCDFDDDGDLDVFLVSSGGASLASESLVRVLRNDGATYTDVTDSVMPTPDGDDWRGETIAFGDVAADVGTLPPDGWPDLVIGSLDESVLPGTRSRVRILANRAGPGDARVFVDRTEVLMAAPSQYDDWRAEDLWIGDLDGDGGIPDIVATHDEVPEGVSPLSPYYVYYLSGTRVFSFATPQSGGYGAFAWQSRRMPQVIGTQIQTPGFPQCIGGACRDSYTPFRGSSLAVADLDGDGRRDIAVSSPTTVTVQSTAVSSTQLSVNRDVQGLDLMLDRTSVLSHAIAPLLGDILRVGNVIGDEREDLVVVRRAGTGSGLAVDVVENRGFETTWPVRSRDLLPAADGDERLQADAAELVDVDGDGDLDLVLLVAAYPTTGGSASGRGLRVLRNHGELGFSRELEDLLPSPDDDVLNGSVLGSGEIFPGRPGFVIARPDVSGDGTEVRTVLRTTEE